MTKIMKYLLIIAALVLQGCGTKIMDIHNMDIEEPPIVLLDEDRVEISITRHSDMKFITDQDQPIYVGVWKVQAVNKTSRCMRLQVLWDLQGFNYWPVYESTYLLPGVVAPIGELNDEVVTYGDFSFAEKGYGYIRELIIKRC